jgi:hypothetical protein
LTVSAKADHDIITAAATIDTLTNFIELSSRNVS